MKRFVVALISSLSLTLLSPISASAAIKSGNACPKLNQIATYAGYKYICIKSGKKFVWSKGVKVVNVTPFPTPTLSPTSSISELYPPTNLSITQSAEVITLRWLPSNSNSILPDYYLVSFNCLSLSPICSGYQFVVNLEAGETIPKTFWEFSKQYLDAKLLNASWEFSVMAGSNKLGIKSNFSEIISSKLETVSVPVPTSMPAVLPRDGDLPLPLTNCGSGNYYYRLNNGILERSFYEDKLFTTQDSRSILTFDPIRVKAYQAMRDHIPTSKSLPVIDFHVSSDFPKTKLAFSKEQLASTLAYWSDFIPTGAHVQATFITEKDSNLISSDDISRPDDAQWIIDTFLDPKQARFLNCGWRYGVSGSHILGNQSKNAGQIGYWIIAPTANGDRYWDPTYLTHEITHGIQDIIWRRNDVLPMEEAGAPYFLIEGAGLLFGEGLSLPNVGWYQDDLYRKIVDNNNGGPTLVRVAPKNTDDILKMIKAAEINDNDAGQTWAYTVGSQLWEWVIAQYGFDAYWNIVKGISKTQNYDTTILKVIGKSKEALYAEAAPYILKGFKEALGKK